MEVVDLCCGDGLFIAALSRMVRHVTAIDLDPKMLDLAMARMMGVTNCKLLLGDAYDVDQRVPGPVDLVFIANTFHGVPDKARLAHAAAAILKPGE